MSRVVQLGTDGVVGAHEPRTLALRQALGIGPPTDAGAW